MNSTESYMELQQVSFPKFQIRNIKFIQYSKPPQAHGKSIGTTILLFFASIMIAQLYPNLKKKTISKGSISRNELENKNYSALNKAGKTC